MAPTAQTVPTQQQSRTVDDVVVGEDNTINYIAVVDTGHGFITAGAATEPYTTQLSYALVQQLEASVTGRLVTAVTAVNNSDMYTLPEDYLAAFKNPVTTERTALLRGLHPETGQSLIDWYTFLPIEKRGDVAEKLAETLFEQVDTRVMQRYRDVVSTVQQVYPQLGKHGLVAVIGDTIWKRVKTRMEQERYRTAKTMPHE